MILILTETRDKGADPVERMLRERGARVARFDTGDFPSRAEVALSYTAEGTSQCTLRVGEDAIDLSGLTAVWDRRPKAPAADAAIGDKAVRDYVEEECKTFLQGVWSCLDCRWVPARRPVVLGAQLKCSQLKTAAGLGFELPPTLITNSPHDLLEFYRRHNGSVVSKVVGFPVVYAKQETFGRYTQLVSKRDVGYAGAVRYCPLIFQARVPKSVELRITVVGRAVFAAEIHSQASNQTCVDWRHYDHFQTPYRPHTLPAELEHRCVRLVERLGLCYGAIDMALTPDGRYVFFEINPNGQYLWIEKATELPISAAICDLLLSGSCE
jgi:hypothetical protein